MSSPFRAILLLLAPLPALVVGVLIMRRSGVSSSIVAQQLAAGLLLTIACLAICLRRRPSLNVTRPSSVIIAAGAPVVLLVLTLLHRGMDGVHRWVSVGPVQLHAGFVALPVLIILAGALGRSRSSRRRHKLGRFSPPVNLPNLDNALKVLLGRRPSEDRNRRDR